MVRDYIAVLFVSFALVMTAGGQARGAEPSAYTVHADAARIGGDQILVNIKLEQADPSGSGTQKTVARPRLLLQDGHRASITIGEEGPAANPIPPAALKAEPNPRRAATPTTAAAPAPAEIVSGFSIDVISVKGQDKVLMVSTVIEKRQTVWADAQTIQVSPEKPKAK